MRSDRFTLAYCAIILFHYTFLLFWDFRVETHTGLTSPQRVPPGKLLCRYQRRELVPQTQANEMDSRVSGRRGRFSQVKHKTRHRFYKDYELSTVFTL